MQEWKDVWCTVVIDAQTHPISLLASSCHPALKHSPSLVWLSPDSFFLSLQKGKDNEQQLLLLNDIYFAKYKNTRTKAGKDCFGWRANQLPMHTSETDLTHTLYGINEHERYNVKDC